MAVLWLLLIALGVLAHGHRIPRDYHYDTQPASGAQGNGRQLAQLPLFYFTRTSNVVCKLQSSEGHQVSGDIFFRQEKAEDPVEIIGIISGLAPGYHGFHIHQNANLSDNCKAAGSHFNPENQSHGAPQDPVRHAGDLGNIHANNDGFSRFQFLDSKISLYENHPRRILGRTIVVHEKEDDLGRGNNEESKKTGNAGARVACCVIEIAPYHYK